ncbi:GNAT family N-acetyltransferase [Saezia sanguinis]|uniref:GNAT family N-acetyltransferase n=1 Tax=Saezia sanguinis TaxID=1965230 RepID=UPI00306FDE8C
MNVSRLNALLKPSGDFGEFHWQINTWSQLNQGATAVRDAVFSKEQMVPTDMDLDGHDIEAVHILVTTADGTPVATGRMTKEGDGVSRIGRMAVLFNCRGNGLGKLMLTELMKFARRRRDHAIVIHAQSYAIGFYKKQGFEVFGEPFMEASIPHVTMRVAL